MWHPELPVSSHNGLKPAAHVSLVVGALTRMSSACELKRASHLSWA